MKKKFLVFNLLLLCFMTGCSKTPELSYDGDEIIHFCTEEDIDLFKGEVDVHISDKQGFVMVDSNSEMKEYTDGVLEITEEDEIDVESCFFVSYEEVTGNQFASRNAISHRDPVEGGMRISVGGSYSYKVSDSKIFADTYSTTEELNRYINTYIVSVYTMNMQSKTYDELASETEFDEVRLEAVNSLVSKYGIEVTNVSIESVEKVS